MWALGFALAAGCNEHHESVEPFRYEGPRKVKTAALESIVDNVFAQTGTIRARREIPLAFPGTRPDYQSACRYGYDRPCGRCVAGTGSEGLR